MPAAESRGVAATPDRPLVVGTVGRLDEIKGHRFLIAAVAHLLEESPARRATLRVRLCGEGPARAALEADIDRRGLRDIVELLGEHADVSAVMRSFNVFVLPSLAEGISNTILEAMASGLPVVATSVGGNPELVTDGRTGLLVSPANPAALAGALARYLDDEHLRRMHGRQGRSDIEERFSLSAMVQRYRALYRDMLTAAPRQRVH
jgi:glycosyltransferase involved in cell wall biosynthesis